ncbi:MAG TPA: arsenate reductase ArsC [Bryobacteraceae bacterium]|nr:arsenate reductase ArsC [Bryobacteraceae bacterium]
MSGNGAGTRKARVLFLCLGNSCRSQMAEGFAKKYGGDVIVAASAGLAPAVYVAKDTLRAMDEKNIDLRDHFPKSLRQLGGAQFDLVVNMSGELLLEPMPGPVREWKVSDPIGVKYDVHCKIRDEIERRVMDLILELRRSQKNSSSPPR